MQLRVGFGFDVHRLTEGRPFYLGGVKIPHHKGALGHSDADVLLHAICDAILGAANLRDIGYHFPDTDKNFEGIDSKILLSRTVQLIAQNNWHIVNIDSTIILEQPKIAAYIKDMQQAIAEAAGILPDCISIKATTNEKMGYIGRQEGISAQAVVLLEKK